MGERASHAQHPEPQVAGGLGDDLPGCFDCGSPYRVVFQSDRGTLTTEQVNNAQGDVLRQLQRQLGAELRRDTSVQAD